MRYVSILLASLISSAPAAADSWPGKQKTFASSSFTLREFRLADVGVLCRVVVPEKAAPGKPWVWRARFFGHEPQFDLAFLRKGYHVAYVDVAGLFGNAEAMRRGEALYAFLTEKHHFHPKPILEGMSRGGLMIYNWAIKHPRRVSVLYGDAPVCDFRSWPGGTGAGKGSPRDWKKCLDRYGLSENETEKIAAAQPINNLKPLAAHKIPIIHVVGDADTVVPVAENTAVVERRIKKLGGTMTVIHKKGVGHHPHSLKDPAPIVDFILKHAAISNTQPSRP